METKKCSECGADKPLDAFQFTRWGKYSANCRECINSKRNESRAANRELIGGGDLYDPEFDGKAPVDVIQLMSRAKRWLESRGYKIRLEGEVTKTHKVKF